jgi:hypothetical protein
MKLDVFMISHQNAGKSQYDDSQERKVQMLWNDSNKWK